MSLIGWREIIFYLFLLYVYYFKELSNVSWNADITLWSQGKMQLEWNLWEHLGSTIASSSSSSNPKHTGHFFSKAETWQKTMRSGILYSVVIFVRIPDYMPLSMCRCVDMAFTNQVQIISISCSLKFHSINMFKINIFSCFWVYKYLNSKNK